MRHRSCTPSRSERIRAKLDFLRCSSFHPSQTLFPSEEGVVLHILDPQGIVASICVPKKLTVNGEYYVREMLSLMGMIELTHPPYSPDLSPCDFGLFNLVKKHLAGKIMWFCEKLKIMWFVKN